MTEEPSRAVQLMDELEGYRRSAFQPVPTQAAWDKTLACLPNPHPLQSWQWGNFKSRWDWSTIPLALHIHHDIENSPPLAAAMILKRKIPRSSISILYVPKGPILNYNDPALRRVVLAQLEQFSRRQRAAFIKIDPDVARGWGIEEERPSPIGSKVLSELQGRGWRFSNDQVQFRNTVELNLQRSEDELLASMKQKTRYNIRLAARKGIKIRLGGPDDFDLIARLYAETASRDGFAVRPVAYYLDAWNTLYKGAMAQPFIAEYEGRPLAAVIIVSYGNRAIYMYGASNNQERKRMPNHLLQWEAIRWAKAQGSEIYDFWGAPDNFIESDSLWGVWRFKKGFNGQVVRHIGAWDFPTRPFWYWTLLTLIPKYLNFLRSRNNA